MAGRLREYKKAGVLRSVYCDKSGAYDELRVGASLCSTVGLQEIAKIMYKVKYNLCPSCISDIFNISNRSYNLRNSGNFTTTYGKHSIRYNGPVIWSKLQYTWLRVHSLRTSLELTLVRTVTCLTLRIINQAGRVSEFVYFSFFDFLFFWVVMVVRWAFDTLIKSLLLLLLVVEFNTHWLCVEKS